jgi:uncharacterized protein (TIGR02246 family)
VKSKLFLSVLLTLFSFSTAAQNRDALVIKQLNQKWLNALVKGDSASLSNLLADDFVLINPAGKRRNKADNLASLHVPGQQITGITIDSEDVRMLSDNLGTITAWTTNHISSGSKKIILKICYLDIWQKNNNRWKAVAAHVSSLK